MFSMLGRVEFLLLRFYYVCKGVCLAPLESSRLCLHPVGHSSLHVQSAEETRHIISATSSENSRILLEKILKFFSRKCDVTQLFIIRIMSNYVFWCGRLLEKIKRSVLRMKNISTVRFFFLLQLVNISISVIISQYMSKNLLRLMLPCRLRLNRCFPWNKI